MLFPCSEIPWAVLPLLPRGMVPQAAAFPLAEFYCVEKHSKRTRVREVPGCYCSSQNIWMCIVLQPYFLPELIKSQISQMGEKIVWMWGNTERPLLFKLFFSSLCSSSLLLTAVCIQSRSPAFTTHCSVETSNDVVRPWWWLQPGDEEWGYAWGSWTIRHCCSLRALAACHLPVWAEPCPFLFVSYWGGKWWFSSLGGEGGAGGTTCNLIKVQYP